MKVLFAIGDAVASENIVKQYFSLYGEKIEYKNVFYFKALLEEVKRDKTYDRIVVSEQLEPPKSNVVDAIDQMIFNNIDSVTDEIDDSAIIFICSDGRNKNDTLIGRLFNIGIYNLLMGDERDIVPLCGLIKEPRNKKEAKEYLKSNPAIGGSVELLRSADEVDEIDLLNISRYFNNLKTREEYLEKFAIVEEQYNEKQLQTIVTALLKKLRRGEEIYITLKSDPRFSKYCVVPGYDSLDGNNDENASPIRINKAAPSAVGGILGFLAGKKMKSNENRMAQMIDKEKDSTQIDVAQEELRAQQTSFGEYADKVSEESKDMMDRLQQEAKLQAEQLRRESEERRRAEKEEKLRKEAELKAQQEAQLKAQQEAQLKAQQEAQLRAQQEAQLKAQQEAQLKAQQEAQLKAQQEAQLKAQQEAQLKAQQEAQLKAQQEAQLKAQQEAQLKAQQEAQLRAQQEAQLKAQQEAQLKAQTDVESMTFGISTGNVSNEYQSQPVQQPVYDQPVYQQPVYEQPTYSQQNVEGNEQIQPTNVPQLMVPADYKKVVAFVGTDKVGTTFIINSIASLMAMKGVKTSILDMTQNRGMYWYYNESAYKKMDVVSNCMTNLSSGVATPIQVGKYKNMNLYTTVPGGKEDNRKSYRHRNLLETAKRECNLLIIDCDFTTPYEYLEAASEVYIVQDLDLIKVQETKNYFRELKARMIDWGKLRLVMNNIVKSKVSSKKIMKNALTYYSDPSMTFVEEFDEIKKFVEIPLQIENYANYIESMQDGKLNYDKFTPEFKQAMEQLSIMVYGMVSSAKKGLFR